MAEAQAMVSQQQQQPALSPILEASDERPKPEAANKRKSISDLEEFGMASSSRQRLSDISDDDMIFLAHLGKLGESLL